MRSHQTPTHRSLPGISALAALLLLAACSSSPGANAPPHSGQTGSPTATPVPLDQLTVYGTADSGAVRALRADTGQVRWQTQRWGPSSSKGPVAASGGKPVVDNGIVYVGGSDGQVSAFKSSDGSLLWSAELGVSEGGPLVVGGVVYGYSITSDSANQTIFVEALRGSDGTHLWKTQVGSEPFVILSQVVVLNGTVYVAMPSGEEGELFVSAYHAGDGSLLWRSQGTPPIGGGEVGLAVDDQAVYAYVGQVYAYNRSDGTLRWSSQCGGPSLWSSTHGFLVQQGIIYAGTVAGEVYACRASDGSLLWQVKESYRPALANGVVYATSQTLEHPAGALLALDGKTGSLLWRYQGDSFSHLLVVGGGMVFGVNDQGIDALDAVTGKLRWQSPRGRNSNTPILMAFSPTVI